MALTDKQQAKAVRFAQMFLSYARNSTADVVNMKTGESQTPMEYANEFLAALGIEATFRPPPPQRDPKTLAVFSEDGAPLAGRVSRWLEEATRREPEKAVPATLAGGWWKWSSHPGVMVRVGAPKP